MNPARYICPTCGEIFGTKGRTFPFCSERCKIADLGQWASERYTIVGAPSEITDSERTVDHESGE